MWRTIRKHHVLVSISLIALFLLLWNLDRYLPICPYGVIPAAIALVIEIIVILTHKR